MRKVAGLALVALLLPLSSAQSPATGTAEFTPPGRVTGAMEAVAAPGSFLFGYQAGRGVTLTLEMDATSADLRLVDTMQEYVDTADTQACTVGCEEAQRTERPIQATRIRVVSIASNLTVILNPKNANAVQLDVADLHRTLDKPVFSSGPVRTFNSLEPYPENSVSWPNKYYVGADGPVHHLSAPKLASTYEGPFFLLVSDAVLEVENETGRHEIRTGTTREYVQEQAAELGVKYWRAHAVALVGEVVGTFRFAYEGPYGHVAAGHLTMHDVSTLSIPLADASVKVPGFEYESTGEPFIDVRGLFSVALPQATVEGGGPRLTATLDGSIDSIEENRSTTVPIPPAAVATTAAGLGLLAVAYIVFSWIRRGAVYVAVRGLEFKLFTFVPFAARLDLARVLEHPVRGGIMTMLAGSHAMRSLADLRRDVASAFGISTLAAYVHLRTLWRANHLTVVRMRGHHFIGPNSGGMGSREQRVAASLLQHPVGLAIAEYVTTHPGASQKEIVAHVQANMPSEGKPMSYQGVLKWIHKFESIKITPTHLVRAFGTSLNPGVDAQDVREASVSLLARESDAKDARVLRYRPTDILYDVVKVFAQRRPELGSALTELTRIRVERRIPPKPTPSAPRTAASTP